MLTQGSISTVTASNALGNRSSYDKESALIESRRTNAYDGLLYNVFQQLRADSVGGVAVAFTAANSGEGVTHSVCALINELCKDRNTRILHVDSRRFREMNCAPDAIGLHCQQIDSNIYEFIGGQQTNGSWASNWEYRRDCIQQLRSTFDYILIDCPAINTAGDLFSVAPLVDGVIMVVEAGTTRVSQILQAEKSIDFARGKLIGHILNKRTFAIPNWLYRLI